MFAALALLYNWPTLLSPTQDIEKFEARYVQMQADTNRKIEENNEKMTAKLQSEVASLRAEARQLKVDLQTKVERDVSIAHENRRQWHERASLRELHKELENKNDQLRKKIDTKHGRTPQRQFTSAATRLDILRAIQHHIQPIQAQLGQQLDLNSTLLTRLENQDGTIANLQIEVDTLRATAATAEKLKYPIKNLEHRAETTETEVEDPQKKVASLEAKKECRCVPAVATAPPATQSTPVTSRISEPSQLGATASNADASSSENTPAALTSSQTPTTIPTEAPIPPLPSLISLAQEVTPTTTNKAPIPDTDLTVPFTPILPDSSSLGHAALTSGPLLWESEPALLTPTSSTFDVSAALEFPRSFASGSTVDDGTTVLSEEPTAPLTGPTTHSATDQFVNIPAAELTGGVADEPLLSRPEQLVEDAVVAPQQEQGEDRSDISTEPIGDVRKSGQKSESNTSSEDHTLNQALATSGVLPESPAPETSGDLRTSEAIPASPLVHSATTSSEQQAQPPQSTSNSTNPNPFKQRRLDETSAPHTPFPQASPSQGQTQSQDTRLQSATAHLTIPQPTIPQPATPLPQIQWRAPEPSTPQTPTPIPRQSSLVNSRNQSTNTLARTAEYTRRILPARSRRRTTVALGTPSVLGDRSLPGPSATGLFQSFGTTLPAQRAAPSTAVAHDDDVEMQEAPAPTDTTVLSAESGPKVELNNGDVYAPSGDVAMAENDDVPSGDAVMAEDDNVAESMNDIGLITSAEALPGYELPEDDDNPPPQVFSSNFFELFNEQEAPAATHGDQAGADPTQHLGFNPDDSMHPCEEDDLAWLTGPGPVTDAAEESAAEGPASDNEGEALAPLPGYAPAKPQSTQPAVDESSGGQSNEVQDSTSTNELPNDDTFDLLNEWLSRDDGDLGKPLPGRRPQQ